MVSLDGEVVPLRVPIDVGSGAVDAWLNQLTAAMRATLQASLQSSAAGLDPRRFIDTPSQVRALPQPSQHAPSPQRLPCTQLQGRHRACP